MQPLILDFNFWHRSFLTTIMVGHYPLCEFLHAAKLNCFIMIVYKNFMLCSFGISTEASAPPVVLSFHASTPTTHTATQLHNYYTDVQYTPTSSTRNSTTLGGVAAMTTASRKTNRKFSRSGNKVDFHTIIKHSS